MSRKLSSMLMIPNQSRKGSSLSERFFSSSSQMLHHFLCSLPEGSSVVSVDVVWNEELSVLDNWVCNNKLSSRVCQKAKTRNLNTSATNWKHPPLPSCRCFSQLEVRGCFSDRALSAMIANTAIALRSLQGREITWHPFLKANFPAVSEGKLWSLSDNVFIIPMYKVLKKLVS